MKSSKLCFSRAFCLMTALLVSLVLSLSFTGCDFNDDDDDDDLPVVNISSDDALVGTWINKIETESYTYTETYVISQTEFNNGYYYGDNLCVRKLSDTEGYIYIKYTKALCDTHSDYSNYSYVYDTDADDVGEWYAIYYKNLTATSITISGAYKENGETAEDTLEEAIAEFTVENGYFSGSSDCTKQ